MCDMPSNPCLNSNTAPPAIWRVYMRCHIDTTINRIIKKKIYIYIGLVPSATASFIANPVRKQWDNKSIISIMRQIFSMNFDFRYGRVFGRRRVRQTTKPPSDQAYSCDSVQQITQAEQQQQKIFIENSRTIRIPSWCGMRIICWEQHFLSLFLYSRQSGIKMPLPLPPFFGFSVQLGLGGILSFAVVATASGPAVTVGGFLTLSLSSSRNFCARVCMYGVCLLLHCRLCLT